MALFLNENIASGKISECSIEEAYNGLLDAALEFSEVTEAILKEDFKLHQNSKMLTEAKKQEKQVSFLAKVSDSVIRLVKKVKESIARFFGSFTSKIKAAFSKLTGRKEEKVPVPRGFLQRITLLQKESESIETALETENGSEKEINSRIEVFKRSVAEFKKKFLTLKSKDNRGMEYIDVAKIATVIGTVVAVGGFIKKSDKKLGNYAEKADYFRRKLKQITKDPYGKTAIVDDKGRIGVKSSQELTEGSIALKVIRSFSMLWHKFSASKGNFVSSVLSFFSKIFKRKP